MRPHFPAMLCGFSLLFISVTASAGDPAQGKQKSVMCAACHGIDGNSVSPDFPRLAGQHEDYIAHVLADYKAGRRKNPIMMGMAAALSKDDIANLAAYFSSQKGLTIVRR